jgi:hypothetical protein
MKDASMWRPGIPRGLSTKGFKGEFSGTPGVAVIAKAKITGEAAAKPEPPAWVIVIEQLPTVNPTTLPTAETEQTVKVVEANVSASFDVELATKLKPVGLT